MGIGDSRSHNQRSNSARGIGSAMDDGSSAMVARSGRTWRGHVPVGARDVYLSGPVSY